MCVCVCVCVCGVVCVLHKSISNTLAVDRTFSGVFPVNTFDNLVISIFYISGNQHCSKIIYCTKVSKKLLKVLL